MSNGTPNKMEQINQIAANWFTLMRSSERTEKSEREFKAWLAESEENSCAYAKFEALWDSMGELASTTELEELRKTEEPEPTAEEEHEGTAQAAAGWLRVIFVSLFEHKVAVTAFASLVIVAMLYLLPQTPKEIVAKHHHTLTGQIITVTLTDEVSQATLSPETNIKAWDTPTERYVDLIRGEAFFDIGKDPRRPFFVVADDTLIRVVGTQFDVRRGVDSISVAVLEGAVDVMEATPDDARAAAQVPLVLTAGQQVVKPKGKAFEAVTAVSSAELGAWRKGRLVYRDIRLIDLIADADRYYKGTISLEADELADQRVTATIRSDNVEHLPEMLAQSLPIAVQTLEGNRIVITRKAP